MRNRHIMQGAFLCLASIFVMNGHAQTIATTTTVTANPPSILYLGSSTITATVTPASGPASALAGLPILFSDAYGTQSFYLDGNGTANIPFTYDPAGNPPATIAASFLGGESQYGNSYLSPSSGSVTLNIVGPSAILQGPYTFLFKGLVPSDGAPIGNATFAVGTLVADGNGNMTGEMDSNSRFGAYFGPVTGTYTLQGSGMGTMTLATNAGVQHFDLWAPGQTGARIATIVATDQNALFGAGTLTQQPNSALANYPPMGNYWLDILGETACLDCTSAGHPVGLITGAATASFSYESVSESMEETIGTALVNAPGSSDHLINYVGTDAPADALGRFTFQLTLPANAFPDQPANFAGYIVDGSHIEVLSTDSHATHMLLLETLRH